MSDQTTDDETLSANTDPVTSWGIVSAFFLLGGLGSTLLIDASNFVSFILVGCLVASPFWILFTESGAEWYAKEVMDSSPEDLKKSSERSPSTNSHSNVICQACGWQNSPENNYCHDCGEELDSVSDDTPAEAESDSTESVVPTTDEGSDTIGLNTDVIEVVAVLGSLCIGCLLGLWFLFNGEIMLAATTFLVAVGWPFLLTRHGRSTARRALGLSRSSRHNEPSESTKECPDCGWHNHRANNNCVECDTGFSE